MTIKASTFIKLNKSRKLHQKHLLVDNALLQENLNGHIDDNLVSIVEVNRKILSGNVSEKEIQTYLNDLTERLKAKGVVVNDTVLLRELACINKRIAKLTDFENLLWDPEKNVVGKHTGSLSKLIAEFLPFGRLDSFNITQVKEGRGPAVIFINGFLSEKETDADDWLKAIENSHLSNCPCYLISWDSGFISKAMDVRAVDTPALVAKFMSDWYDALSKASKVGSYLSYILQCTDHDEGFVIMGHSLGARVTYYLMDDLAKVNKKLINEAYLLGGAVGNSNKDCRWTNLSAAVTGNIYNLHSDEDAVLKLAYQASTVGSSHPIGLHPVKAKNVVNIDVTKKVASHTSHKENFDPSSF